MREVDIYVNKLYKRADPKHPQTRELKEETRIHLNDSVKELMRDGFTRNQAFSIAVERYGGFEQAEKLISLMQIRQRTFANWLLKIGIFSIVVASCIFLFLLYIGNFHDIHFAELGYKAGENSILKSREEINYMFLEEPYIIKAKVELRESNPQDVDFIFEGNKLWIPSLFIREMYYGTDQSFVSLEVVDVRKIGFFQLAISLTIYYVLFTIWGLIQVYHAGRLKLIWIISLLALNVFGYLLFLLKNKKILTKTF